MALFGRKKPEELSRRELVAQRRSAASNESQQASASSFKRSRTLSRLKQADRPSERQAAWDLRKQRRRILTMLGAASLGIGLVVFLLSQLSASVVVAGPDGEREHYSQYEDILNEYFATRPLERLRFMVDQPALQGFFIERASEVQSVRIVGGDSIGKGLLRVSFRQPIVQWSSADRSYFVDGSGVTFEKNYFDAPGISVEDQSGLPPELGQESVNSRFLSFLGQAVSLLSQQGIEVGGIVLPQDTIRQVEIHLLNRPYRIKLTIDRGVEAQVQEAVHAIAFIEQRGLAPEYIDVRVDQRVFYR